MKPSRLWLYKLMTGWLPETRCFGFKAALLRWCGAKIGNNVRICSSVVFSGDGMLEIGDDVWIGAGSRIVPVGDGKITIESHCDLGPEVMVLTGSHAIDPDGPHIGGKGTGESVFVGCGCWLGARSTLLPGVSLPPKTVVAAGAVVIEGPKTEKTLIAGVPAKEKKTL